MNLQELLVDTHALEEDLLGFERQYGVRSETFYAAYASGEEPENEEWVRGLRAPGSGDSGRPMIDFDRRSAR